MPHILDQLPHRQLASHDIKSEFGNQAVADIAQQLLDGEIEPIIKPAEGVQSVNKIELARTLKLTSHLESELKALIEKASGSADILIENDLVFKWSFDQKAALRKSSFYTTWCGGEPKDKGIQADFIDWPRDFYVVHDCAKYLALALKKVDAQGGIVWILLVQQRCGSSLEKLEGMMEQCKEELETNNVAKASAIDTLSLPIFNVRSEVEYGIPADYEFKGVIEKSSEAFYRSAMMHYKQKAYLELTEHGWYGEAVTSLEFRSMSMPPHGTPRHYEINGPFGCSIFSPQKPPYFTANINKPGIKGASPTSS